MKDDPSPAYISLQDNSYNTLRSEAITQVQNMWAQSYNLDSFEMTLPQHWLSFSQTLGIQHMFNTAACYEVPNLLEKQRRFNSSAFDIPGSQHNFEVDLR